MATLRSLFIGSVGAALVGVTMGATGPITTGYYNVFSGYGNNGYGCTGEASKTRLILNKPCAMGKEIPFLDFKRSVPFVFSS